jgi:hypothetical protein
MFTGIQNSNWNLTVSYDLESQTDQYKDKYMYGGIGEDNVDDLQDKLLPNLVFCGEFFTFPTLDYRL